MINKIKDKIEKLSKTIRLKLLGVPEKVKYRGKNIFTIKNSSWSKRVYLTGRYSWNDKEELEIMKEYIEKGDVVFDIGAFVGTHTIMMSSIVGNNGKVYSFEPQNKGLKIIEKNIKENDISNCEVFCTSVGEREGDVELRTSDTPNGTSNTMGVDPWDKLKQTQKVNQIRLDKFMNRKNIEYVNFIKIDVQGAGAGVIEGIGERLEDVGTIYMEIHSKYIENVEKNAAKILNILSGTGNIYKINNDGIKKVSGKKQIIFENNHPTIIWENKKLVHD